MHSGHVVHRCRMGGIGAAAKAGGGCVGGESGVYGVGWCWWGEGVICCTAGLCDVWHVKCVGMVSWCVGGCGCCCVGGGYVG